MSAVNNSTKILVALLLCIVFATALSRDAAIQRAYDNGVADGRADENACDTRAGRAADVAVEWLGAER